VAYGDEPTQDLPEPAGSGGFLGMPASAWLGALSGLLSNVRVGPPGAIAQGGGLRIGQALMPLAQGLDTRDKWQRTQQMVQGLAQEYGDMPETKPALILMNGGDLVGGVRMLTQGIAARNQQAKEQRMADQTGKAALGAVNTLRPVSQPAITGLRPLTPEDADTAGVGEAILRGEPPVQPPAGDFLPADRAPNMTEILDRVNEIAKGDPTVAGLAAEKLRTALEARTLEESKLRPSTAVHGGALIRTDPLRGTAKEVGRVTPSPLDVARTSGVKALQGLREAETLKAQRETNAPAGTERNPHITYKTYSDQNGTRTQYELRAFTRPNPNAPGGVEQITHARPLGPAPWKPFAPKGEGGVKETLSTEEKITPRKRIMDDSTFRALQGGVQDVVNDVTNKFTAQGLDFNTPGSYVTLRSGEKIRKEDVLSKAFKARHGIEGTFVWRNGQFALTQAWAPEIREPIAKRRVVGPAGTIKQYEPQDDTGDEEQ